MQALILNVVLFTHKKLGVSDNINDVLDYDRVSTDIKEWLESSSFLLIEKCAEELAQKLLGESLVEYVNITLDKPDAIDISRSVAVSIFR